MSGIYVPNTTSAVTVKIQVAASSGTAQIAPQGTLETGIEWEIYQINPAVAAGLSNTVNAWSGYHDSPNQNSFSRASSSYGDFANGVDASMALTQVNNSNFGTVTGYGASSGTSALPGIVFTPPSTGLYVVKASMTFNIPTGNHVCGVRLTDGTTIIDGQDVYQANGQTYFAVTLTGILNITSLASKTIKLQAASDTGVSINLTGGSSVVSGTHYIEWSLFQISGLTNGSGLSGGNVAAYVAYGIY
jgi:hypothetical protein